nr:translationally-controlled tumor protein-like [Delphinus delphis]
MIIYRDLINHDEMISDIYKIREVTGVGWGAVSAGGGEDSRTEGNTDDLLIGGNASAEGREGEGTESTVITGVGIVMNRHLQETSFTREAYRKYIRDFPEQIKHILANFKNDQFFTGENISPDGMAALLDYREGGVTPCMIFFREGLGMEKCEQICLLLRIYHLSS